MVMAADTDSKKKRVRTKRLIPVAVLLLGAALFFAFDLHAYVTADALRDHRHELLQLVADYPVLVPALYMALYAVVVIFSLPGGAVMTLTGGFLFGPVEATIYTVAAATMGATSLFLIAKTSLGEPLHQKAGPWLHRLEKGFRENELSYLLFLRLVPAFPFFVVNLVPAFLGVSLRTYLLGTFFGIIPGTAVYAYVGSGLGHVFDAGEDFSVGTVLSPEILGALTALGLLALLPAAVKKLRAYRRTRTTKNP